MTTLTQHQFNFLFKDNKMTDYGNSSKEVIFSKVEITKQGLVLIYKTFNHKFECGGYKTKVFFTGDINEIIDNINHLIFNCVEFKKRKFENIKISFKTVTGSFKNE